MSFVTCSMSGMNGSVADSSSAQTKLVGVMSRPASAWLMVVALSSAFACGGGTPPPRVAPPPPPPQGATAQAPTGVPVRAPAPAASDRLEIRWVKSSAEYEASVRQVYRLALAHIEHAAAGRAAGTWGVVLDADETVISNL